MSGFKLTMEIRKPVYAQKKTVREAIPRSLWNAVRNDIQSKSDFQCQICGRREEGKLQAHEVWDYDEEKFLLILQEIQALCKSCHDLKHIHHAARRTKDSKARALVMQKLKNHFMKVNACTEADFHRHYRNQVAKSETSLVARSLEDLIELRELREREAFLSEQKWRFVIAGNVPFAEQIKAELHKKGLLYEGEEQG
ncbi:hypothetical protein MUN89_02980 [Halobacillus salinarum]|uniref:HNH endonuclease n=1 Tax=Halobacillus salinarum TaxID=2932257 RepID=A0ABY4EKD8_9BACI|nr:hypothetical protein [Halobacillus salinarum]UOQ44933.1 hypothetical protein MUN89_02980 [Halobacillus salinarum]